MPLTLRTITNAGAPLYTPNGTLLANTKLTFELVDTRGKAISAWDGITEEAVVGNPTTVTTDAQGIFAIQLWPTTRGTEPLRYRCSVDNPNFAPFMAPLPDEVGSIFWIDFMLQGTPLTYQERSLLDNYIASIEAAELAASNYANAASGSAATASTKAGEALASASAASGSAATAAAVYTDFQIALTSVAANLIQTQTIVATHHAFI